MLVNSRIIEEDKESGKFLLSSDVLKVREPLRIHKKEDLIVVLLENERYIVNVEDLEKFVRKFGKKLTSNEYWIR